MRGELNFTLDPARRSWVESANQPAGYYLTQNVPFGLFSTTGSATRGGVALGDQIINLAGIADQLHGAAAVSLGNSDGSTE